MGDPQKRIVLSIEGSFHGTTLMTMATSGERILHNLYGPMPEGFVHIPIPHPRFCEWCREKGECTAACAGALERRVVEIGPENIAAMIIEPVMGTRVLPLPARFVERVRAIADDYDFFLIFDEVVTGFGRLGTMFAADYYGIIPDIMCLAKGITSGYSTMGAVLVRERIYAGFDGPGLLHFANGSSTDGHPVACAAGLAVLRIFDRESILARAASAGKRLKSLLERHLFGNRMVAQIRGVGLYVGVEILGPDALPAPLALMRSIRDACERRGVLVHYTENLLIIMPPLIIAEGETDLIIDAIEQSLAELAEVSSAGAAVV